MTDGQTLLAVFVVLYLIECLRLVPATCWMGAGSGTSGWGVVRPWSRLHVSGGSPLLLSPLPPMQAHSLALPWLFVPGDEALRVRLTDTMSVHICWELLAPRAVESMLHLDAATHLRMPSKALAKLWQQRLTEWRDISPDQRRSAFLKHARYTLDTSAVKSATSTARATRSLRTLSTIHFMWCFGFMSAVYYRFGDGPAILAAAGVLLLLQFTQAWLFLRCTRKSPIAHRRWRAFGIAFLPQLAMRAFDVVDLSADAEPPHPLAWHGLLDERLWLHHAQQFWREARYVPGWTQSEALPLEAEALQKHFRHLGVTGADYDPPSTSTLPTCPRCKAEYQKGMTSCLDCSGVELKQPAS